MRGQRVCWSHGGASPQARGKADERLQALVFPALEVIAGYVERREPEEGVPSAVRLRAAEAILDRAGYSATHRVEMSGEMTVVSPVDLELEEIAARLEKVREAAPDVP